MGFFHSLFILSVLKVTNTFVLHVNSSCNVQCLRTTVHDVMMMYCKERNMENVPRHAGAGIVFDTQSFCSTWE